MTVCDGDGCCRVPSACCSEATCWCVCVVGGGGGYDINVMVMVAT